MEKKIYGLTIDQWVELRDFIAENMGYEKYKVATAMDEFAQKFSIKAMFNFYVGALKDGQDISWILATIGHDLGGRNDKYFAPRTESYENMEEE